MYIFFDLDDTLVDSDFAHVSAIKKISKDYSICDESETDLLVKDWLELKGKYLNRYFRREIGLEEQRLSRVRNLWSKWGKDITDEAAMKFYWKYHHNFLHSCKVFFDTITSLKMLEDIRMGVISNGTSADQMFKLQFNHLVRFFEVVIISEKVGFSKPEKEIFEYAADKVHMPVNECVFVGNSYNLDYLGAMKAGMQPVWLDRGNKPDNSIYMETDGRPDDKTMVSKISSLIELPALLNLTLF